jgi:phage anti-repressor protein
MGFLLSVSSVYLNHIVFADDSWSDIVKRQQSSQQKALETYHEKYAFSNMDESKRNWSGLTSTATDETSRGRNIEAQQQISLQNAVAQFDTIHVTQLANLTTDDYKGISSTPTDTQGRDRNVLIENARASSLVQDQDILNQLEKIQQNYANLKAGPTTDSVATYDRQTRITKNMDDAEARAADLVSKLAKIDNVYIDLSQYVGTNIPYTYKSGSITNEVTQGGRNIPAESAYALEKAVMIFNEIHDKHIAEIQSNYYGLTSTPTDTQGRDRNVLIENAREVAITNAMRVYNTH